MQILKVLLVVLLVVNLTNGFFFKKQNKKQAHHPPPVRPQYAAPYPYTYIYYYQPIPHYYYEPVHVAPAAPTAPVIPAAPAIPTAHAIPTAPAVPVVPAIAPIAPKAPCPKPTQMTHLSSRQALPVFEPASFSSASSSAQTPNVEILRSVGFQMGTETDIIEVHKSQGKYIALPAETVLVDNIDSKKPTAGENKGLPRPIKDRPMARSTKPTAKPAARPTARPAARPTKAKPPTLIKLRNDDSAKSNSLPVLAAPSLVDTGSKGIVGKNSQTVESGAFAIDVRTADENLEVPAELIQLNQDTSSPLLIEEVTLPAKGVTTGIVNTTIAPVLNDASFADVLLSAKSTAQAGAAAAAPAAGTIGLPGEVSSSAEEALTFPEVQQLLNELIKHEEFDAKRLKKDVVSSGGGAQPTNTVEIDPQVSYSRVARQ